MQVSLRRRGSRTGPGAGYGTARRMGEGSGNGEEVYNVIPIHNLLADHPSLKLPEVRAAMAALRTVGELRKPPFVRWHGGLDLLDWLGAFFGFQRDNIRNQREHLVLLLANAQMRIHPPPDDIDVLHGKVVRRVRKKLLHNYTAWCSYLGRTPNVWIDIRRAASDPRRELLYAALYLLIWGEAANVRFVPECLSYIFHHMAGELNRILEDYIDEATGQPALPAVSGENAFLTRVITPIYETIKREVDASRNGTEPHSAWRNYDDINEYFWNNHCFESLRWPLDRSKNFFATSPTKNRVGKTGFVEQRSFWNLYRSFDRLWVMLILFLQAAIIVAWHGSKTYPWQNLQIRDDQVRVLTIFITWAGLRLLQSLLDVGTQYKLVSRETRLLGVRMVLKILVAATWTAAFPVLYSRMWNQRNRDRTWSAAANRRLSNILVAAAVFILPQLLAVALFVLPWLRNFLEKTNWRIFYVLTWWFQGRTFVGRGLREGPLDSFKYALFWTVLLAVKFIFSYLLQIEPMISPTKTILNLQGVQYQWHEFFPHSNTVGVFILWLPVILIYLMDIQIWYSIFSSIAGALVGLFSHLGEIRDVQQLRLRFQFFASALQFHLMPEEHVFRQHGSLQNRIRDTVNRLKLRYGLGRPYNKIESHQVGPSRFALIWNEIIHTFREEDIVNDREVELLELLPYAWNIRVVRWPCLLLGNELLLALGQAKELKADDRRLWRKISKHEYRRCAVIEAYDSIKYLFLEIIKEGTEEHSIVAGLFEGFDSSIRVEKFTIYEDEWANFLERMKREGMTDEEELWGKRSRDLRLWASYRGQTLSRTVRGMMYYYKALKMLAFLDSASEIDIREGSRELPSVVSSRRQIEDLDNLEDGGKSSPSQSLSRASSSVGLLFKGHEHGTALMKYTYVVACQIYGNQKAKNDTRANDILYLMKNNEALRVAYVDEVKSVRDEVEYFSVLVKYDQQLEKEVEIYRVKLPGPLKLGEGKPENQNHALIFTRGDAIQTIDMNQDNYFEEALKMRNLLEEYSSNYGARKPNILGIREHVFTGSVSSLAGFMSAQETSFIRMHYGHPNVFDRLWFLSRGGISKASRVINISEDIFAGFNCTLRGGNVTHHEYIQVGKGREVGLNQISMFEAKVACGNGEQTLSRDVYRLGHRLDFFRMLSFFYTSVGFYFNTMMAVLTVYAFVWGRLYLALSGLESSIGRNAVSNNATLGTVLIQQFIIELGLLTALPMIIENSLEHDFLPVILDFLTTQLQLASVFYTFSMGTKTHYYGRTILHGGAKYRATGRGFVVEHKKFAENYRLYARSHFIKGIELGIILTLYAAYSAITKNTFVYIAMTFSSWFLVISWIMAPFAFNPSGFDWLKTVYD
ncbi:hypothetical protein ZIOFF_009361 [Zingiber officinale]|uniref:1,3-beta-glucan synthase n=1 Tax=Zingiber officinale TaxID=94328 RepID=A0A8J5HKX0_ZINOF|nr:hypothetical protein ZIOFF_009361 [Zingiber officinale]